MSATGAGSTPKPGRGEDEGGPSRGTGATIIRRELPGDVAGVHAVNDAAFEHGPEADLVDALRAACGEEALSLVAIEHGGVVGHVLFTPATIDHAGRPIVGMGLAPLAVLPDRQRAGVGSDLVRRGLDVLRERGCPFVIVLGHPAYYPRFGFQRAAERGIVSQWEVPADAFMVLVLDEGAMAGVAGVARYRAEFDAAV